MDEQVKLQLCHLTSHSMSKPKVLIYGATGAQGGAIARRLAVANYPVRGILLASDTAEALRVQGIEPVVADLADEASLVGASQGVHTAVLTIPLSHDAPLLERYGQAVAKASQRAGVKHVIYNSSAYFPDSPTGLATLDVKAKTVQLLRAHGLVVTVLQPAIYLDNLWIPGLREAITTQGVLPYPIRADVAVPWLSHDNLARYAEVALADARLHGQSFRLRSDQLYTGPQLAAVLAHHLARPVQYVPLSPEAFGQQVEPLLGPDYTADLVRAYHYWNDNFAKLIGEPSSQIPAQLESVDEWAKRFAA